LSGESAGRARKPGQELPPRLDSCSGDLAQGFSFMLSRPQLQPRFLLALGLFVVLGLTGCRAEPAPATTATADATEWVPTPTFTLDSPVTAAAPATATSRPTQAARATAAGPSRTPSPTPTSAPHEDVAMQPYAASACSDKYPCNDDRAGWEARIQVPAGFTATYFARLEGQPTSLAFGPDGRLYVSTQAGEIMTVDSSGQVAPYLDGFDTPTGLAFRPGTGDLYVSDRVLNLNEGGEAQISVVRDGRVRRLFGGIPCCYTYFHAANGIAFGPDGYGYVGVGATADHGEILPGNPGEGEQDDLVPWEATILRFSPDGREVEPYAFGLRNAYDLAWDAAGRLYATDNAPDFGPPDELHRVEPGGQHGYPWYHCDVCFAAPAGIDLVPPLFEFVPHAAAAGLTVYQDEHFPGYFNNLFVALWSAFDGAQRIVRLGPDGQGASDFATGFAAPIDVTVGPDGRLYVADWATGILFQIAFEGQ
jgi:glucose/arabinose dehydrogenase